MGLSIQGQGGMVDGRKEADRGVDGLEGQGGMMDGLEMGNLRGGVRVVNLEGRSE